MGIIRFLLAVSVVLFHSKPILGVWMVYGFDAVPLFYIISGFYMSLILNGKYTEWTPFITNRLLKIFPTYLVVFALGVLATYPLYNDILHQPEWTLFDRIFLIFTNCTIFGTEFYSILSKGAHGIRFLGMHEPRDIGFGYLLVIGPVWSLSVELQFYLLAPFVVKHTKRATMLLLLLIAAGLAYDVFIYRSGAEVIPWGYNFFPPSIKYFALGAISYRLFLWYQRIKSTGSEKRARILRYGERALLLGIIGGLIGYDDLGDLKLLGLTIQRVYYASFVLFLAIAPCFTLTMKNRYDRFLGDLSYPIYISHYLFTYHYKLGIHPLIPTLALSCALFWGVITPLERYRQRRVLKNKTSFIQHSS